MIDHPAVRQFVHVEEVDSTNDLARRLIATGPMPRPALILAERQTRGRGQRQNTWWSDAGSLTFSLVIDPGEWGLSLDRQPRVALAAALVVAEVVADRIPGCSPGIRWPNDVEVGGRKLGGILPERVDAAHLIIGIGLNVRTQLQHAPPEVARMAASLVEWAPDVAKPDLLVPILDRLLAALAALGRDDPDLPRRWQGRDTLIGTTIRVDLGTEIIHGRALGIEADGGLRIDRDGKVSTIHAGRVLRNSDG